MLEPEIRIQQLQREAQLTRERVVSDLEHLDYSTDIPARVRRTISENPLKTAALATAGGMLAVKVVPLLFRLAGNPICRTIASSLISTVGLPAIAALAQRFAGSQKHDRRALR